MAASGLGSSVAGPVYQTPPGKMCATQVQRVRQRHGNAFGLNARV